VKVRTVGLVVLSLAAAALVAAFFWRSSMPAAPPRPVALDLFGSPAGEPPEVSWPAAPESPMPAPEPPAVPDPADDLPARLLEPPEIIAFA
jgi:hypothetical protein